MSKFVLGLVAIFGALAFTASVRAEEALTPEQAAIVKDFKPEIAGKVDHGEWLAAINAEEAAIDAEKDGKRGELWHPVLARLKKAVEALRDGKAGIADVKVHFAKIKEDHPLLWHRLAVRVNAIRAERALHGK